MVNRANEIAVPTRDDAPRKSNGPLNILAAVLEIDATKECE